MFERVTIVGVGLLGGSLGAAIRRRKLAREVVGAGRDRERLERARKRKLIDRCTLDLEEGCRGADLVVLCTPPDEVMSLGTRILKHNWLERSAILSDVAGVKAPVVSCFMRLKGGDRFVGAHPMAGKEKSGFERAEPGLFEGRTCAVTPVKGTNRRALRAVSRLWGSVGAKVIEMSPEAHDRRVALVSHVPHVLSFAYADLISGSAGRQDALRLAAGSFQDMTRVSSGPPEMWASLFRLNRQALAPALAALLKRLREMERWMKGRPEHLDRFLRNVSKRRNDWA